jgi:hypothetical protein
MMGSRIGKRSIYGNRKINHKAAPRLGTIIYYCSLDGQCVILWGAGGGFLGFWDFGILMLLLTKYRDFPTIHK